MKTLLLFQRYTLVLALTLLFAPSVLAQDIEPTEAQKQHLANQLEQTKTRLGLTDEQVEVVEPILANSLKERLAVMDKYGIRPQDPNFKRPKMSTMRKMRKDMDRLDSQTKKQLEEHLTDEQMSAWEALEKEQKDRTREQMRNGG